MLEHKEVLEKALAKIKEKEKSAAQTKQNDDYKLIAKSKYFNKRWYLKMYPDVKKAGVNPVEHYLKHGWKEGRNPGPKFDGYRYLLIYKSIINSQNICPLLHYERIGKYKSLMTFSTLIKFPKRCKNIKKEFNINLKPGRNAIFAIFSSNGKIPDTTIYYLKGLKEICENIIVVADNPIFEEEVEKIRPYVCYCQFKRHGEYDFGSYKRGFFYAKRKGILDTTTELIICNDSCYGPVFPFSETLSLIENNVDFWGLVSNHSINYHIQSYFWVVRPKVFRSKVFSNFLKNIKKEVSARDVILKYETKFTEKLQKANFICKALFEQSIDEYPSSICQNLTRFPIWLLKQRCPLVKVKALQSQKYNIENIEDTFNIISKYNHELYTLLNLEFAENKKIQENIINHLIECYQNRNGSDYSLIAKSKYFDKRWYLKMYPDVKKAGVNPVEHYLKHGWKEGRNPGPKFDGNVYLDLNADVKRAKINPLLHYEKHGKKEGRKFQNQKCSSAVYKLAQFIRTFKNKKIKKIVLFSHELTYTGAPLSLLKAAECLKNQGYQIVVISLKDGLLATEFKKIGKVIISANLNKSCLIASFCDFAIINTITLYNEYNALKNLIPTVWWIRESSLLPAANKKMCEILSHALNLYTMSEYSRQEFLPYNNNIKIIKHGLNDCYHNIHIHTHKYIFSLIGTIEPRKAQDIYIKAIKLLNKDFLKKCEFHILGKMGDVEFYDDILKHSDDVPEIKFLAPISDFDSMIRYYENISCVVVPSREEPTSRVTLEAMMMGRPAIISDHVGARYVLKEGENGYTFPSENAQKLASCIEDMVAKLEKSAAQIEKSCREAYLKHNSLIVLKKALSAMVNETADNYYKIKECYKPNKIDVKSILARPIIPDDRNLKLTIVVPIYNALSDVKNCLTSLLEANLLKQTKVILMDDCSNKETQNYLQKFTNKHSNFKLCRNNQNLGFIKNCNKGIDLAKGDIVVLLNSDTKVPLGFDKRVLQCFKSDKNIALASPLSIHSGFFKIPENKKYQLPQIDKIVQKTSENKYPMITPEGFCYALRKEVTDKIGKLDEIFGMGYCEEDDLDMRALLYGYRTVLIDNLIVYHKRHASFSSEKREEILERNRIIFHRRWGNQQAEVRKDMKVWDTVENLNKKINGLIKIYQE